MVFFVTKRIVTFVCAYVLLVIFMSRSAIFWGGLAILTCQRSMSRIVCVSLGCTQYFVFTQGGFVPVCSFWCDFVVLVSVKITTKDWVSSG